MQVCIFEKGWVTAKMAVRTQRVNIKTLREVYNAIFALTSLAFGWRHFACLPHFWRENVCFWKKSISKYNKFVFSGQMNLRIIAELLKNARVLLKCLESFW